MARTSDMVVSTLIEMGVDRVFTLPGLGITWTLDAFHAQREKLKVVLTRSEQTASVMAQVVGRLTGRPGVLMGQGPFTATTGAFGILEAHFAGSPMLVLTETSDYDGFGQYGVYQTMTGDYGGADIQAMLRSITKYVTYATEPQDAVYGLQLAYKHASLPRQGPAAVIMKSGIVRREMPDAPRAKLFPSMGYLQYTATRPDEAAVSRLGEMLTKAERPVVIAGNGAAHASDALARLATRDGIAVTTSYNGKGIIDETAAVCAGMLGTWGCPTANRTVAAADLVVVLGASLAPDYTRFRDPRMIRPGEQKIVQVDIDPRNAGWVVPVDLAITGDVGDVLALLEKTKPAGRQLVDQRLAAIKAIKRETGYDQPPRYSAAPGSVHFTDIVATLQRFLGADDMLTLDAGANRIWATNALRMRHPGRLLVPGGIGGMGWGAPAAAGAKLVYPRRRVTCLTGDGGFAMTAHVLATCMQEDIPIVVLVANNAGLGMVRDNLGNSRIAVDYTDINFARIAEGFGASGMRVSHPGEIGDALAEAHRRGGPVVIDVRVDPAASHRDAVDP
ncbi:MAG: thiamine pyrophosphate-binding protein [Hyphomicrobiaceae bacterium]|nr:MAG: thiamine pyrophosphate-binding protein [Hyphomicrobiaceae bacterium]